MTNRNDCTMFTFGRSPSAAPETERFTRRGSCAQNPVKSKYERWYEELCAKAKGRAIPTCYTEVHHIKPRSLGGSDHPSNLVRLEYREHFVAHWLLTKFHTGLNLVKMQKALLAMTMNVSGQRRPTGLQVEAAKRAVRDIELNDEAHEAWYNRRSNKRQAEFKAQRELEMEQEAQNWADAIETAKMFSPEAVAKVLARKGIGLSFR